MKLNILKLTFPSEGTFSNASGQYSPPVGGRDPSATITSQAKDETRGYSSAPPGADRSPPVSPQTAPPSSASASCKGKRGRPRKHAPKLALPPLYVFIRNLLYNPGYNPAVIAWVDYKEGCFKVGSPTELNINSNKSSCMFSLWPSMV